MTVSMPHLTTGLVLMIVLGLIVLAIIAAFIGRALVHRGLREPFVVRLINKASERVVDTIKKPLTIAVLGEVGNVLQAGNYTRNIAAALEENHDEIKQMFAEKIKQDPSARFIGRLPFHDKVISEATETTLRVLLEVLADPRTDELISDLLRDNITQIRYALRQQQNAI
ncbi:MAG: hypothetical protein ABI232_11290 [Jatrophihabitantaceae bacterium]